MIGRTFACSEGCSSMELGPDLGPSTKPCDCWNAEITKLRARIGELEKSMPDPATLERLGCKMITYAVSEVGAKLLIDYAANIRKVMKR